MLFPLPPKIGRGGGGGGEKKLLLFIIPLDFSFWTYVYTQELIQGQGNRLNPPMRKFPPENLGSPNGKKCPPPLLWIEIMFKKQLAVITASDMYIVQCIDR